MTKKATGAWMKLYLDAFKGGTGHMSPAELGAYTRLLLHGWDNGGIPTDLRRMARIAGMDFAEFEVAWEDALREKFSPHPDDPKRLVNAKQETVRGEQEKHVAQRKAAADARWSKGKDANGMREACDRISEDGSEPGCEPPCETAEDLGIQGLGTEGIRGPGARPGLGPTRSRSHPRCRRAGESWGPGGSGLPGRRALGKLWAVARRPRPGGDGAGGPSENRKPACGAAHVAAGERGRGWVLVHGVRSSQLGVGCWFRAADVGGH